MGRAGHATSSVTDAGAGEGAGGIGDIYSSPGPAEEPLGIVDWSTLTIIVDKGDMAAIADEDKLFEAMDFKEADEKAAEQAATEYAIPFIPAKLQEDMREAGLPVDDKDDEEPICDWNRDNPDMSVGTAYPCMSDFRLAVRQHAIVEEFELGTEKPDPTRFRGFCKANGCPWLIRAKTQHDSIVRVQINSGTHTCASTSRVLSSMASQAWVAERAIPLLKKKADMGAKVVQLELEDKYKIKIPYQTVWYGRQRAADKLFGNWDDSFDWLYRFKAEVDLRSPRSVVEIDTIEVEGKVHFNRFFCAFKGSIDGFLQGCRPYISIDSTHLNGL